MLAQVKDPSMVVSGQQLFNKIAGKGKDEGNANKD